MITCQPFTRPENAHSAYFNHPNCPDKSRELLQHLHYADYYEAMRLLTSLSAQAFDEIALKAGFSTISRKAHGKAESINHVMRQFARDCCN